jgi:hypothetical protein
MADLSQQLHEGMEVYTADETKLGKISQVWYGTSVGGPTVTEEETCFELHRGFLGRDTLYLPSHLVTDVSGNTVRLSADEQTVRETPSWHRKPAWIS